MIPLNEKAPAKSNSSSLDIFNKWYIRYASAALMLAMAVICLGVSTEQIHLQALMLILFNPIMGIVYILMAAGLAWEISSLAIIFTIFTAIGYGLFIIITALPISMAVIIGAIIIAIAIKSRK